MERKYLRHLCIINTTHFTDKRQMCSSSITLAVMKTRDSNDNANNLKKREKKMDMYLYLFLRAVVTNDHTSWVACNNRNLFSYSCGGQPAEIKVQADCTPSRGSRGESLLISQLLVAAASSFTTCFLLEISALAASFSLSQGFCNAVPLGMLGLPWWLRQ